MLVLPPVCAFLGKRRRKGRGGGGGGEGDGEEGEEKVEDVFPYKKPRLVNVRNVKKALYLAVIEASLGCVQSVPPRGCKEHFV